MRNKKIIYFGLVILLVITIVLGVIIIFERKQRELKVSFLDVGQGDAILIESGEKQVLIDGGKNGKLLLERLGEEMPFWDRKIEAVIITHPDFDHYGGLIDAFDFYQVENLIKTQAGSTADAWRILDGKISEEKSAVINSTAGSVIKFPCGAELEIIYPMGNVPQETEDKNDSSIVARLKFGENEFLLTGDLSENGEWEILNSGQDISADFLKVGHHGSKSSTSDEFLKKVAPKEAIISVGKNNYGHPTQEVLEKLKNSLVQIWRTDEDGTIECKCKNINSECVCFGS